MGSEQGLLGLAFHPNYATPDAPGAGTFYVNYTDYGGDSHISRFSVRADDPNRADPAREIIYLTHEQPYPNHNGGNPRPPLIQHHTLTRRGREQISGGAVS